MIIMDEQDKIPNDLNNKDWRVRRAVAENPSAPVEALAALAKDGSWRVRRAVARKSEHTGWGAG